MVVSAVIVVAIVLVALFVLEILNAFVHSAYIGLTTTRIEGEVTPGKLLRALVAAPVSAGSIGSHVFHEYAHALGQLISLRWPRVVFCTGGGYSAGRPLPGIPGAIATRFGDWLFNLLSAMAPLVFGAAILATYAVWASPLGIADIEASLLAIVGSLQAAGPSGAWAAVRDLAGLVIELVRSMGLLATIGFVVLSILAASSLTPSSVDYRSSLGELVGWAVGTVAAVVAMNAGLGGAMLLGAGVAVTIVGTPLRAIVDTAAVQTVGASLVWYGLLALTPVLRWSGAEGILLGWAAIAATLGLMVVVHLFAAGSALVTTLVALDFGGLWAGLRSVPSEIASVFLPIITCDRRRMMFQDRCDYCGVAAGDYATAGCQASTMGSTSLSWQKLRAMRGADEGASESVFERARKLKAAKERADGEAPKRKVFGFDLPTSSSQESGDRGAEASEASGSAWLDEARAAARRAESADAQAAALGAATAATDAARIEAAATDAPATDAPATDAPPVASERPSAPVSESAAPGASEWLGPASTFAASEPELDDGPATVATPAVTGPADIDTLDGPATVATPAVTTPSADGPTARENTSWRATADAAQEARPAASLDDGPTAPENTSWRVTAEAATAAQAPSTAESPSTSAASVAAGSNAGGWRGAAHAAQAPSTSGTSGAEASEASGWRAAAQAASNESTRAETSAETTSPKKQSGWRAAARSAGSGASDADEASDGSETKARNGWLSNVQKSAGNRDTPRSSGGSIFDRARAASSDDD